MDKNAYKTVIADLLQEISKLKNRVAFLETLAHPKKDFVTCEKCNKAIKRKE